MSEFNGTPGPWFYSGKHEECDVRYVSTSTNRDVVNDVAVLFSGEPEERQANANLIAAAPELLEALQDALHAYDKHGEHSEWDSARAAIAKALGQ